MIVLFFLDMRNLQEQVKKAFCYQSQKNVKFSAFSLEFQKFFSITRPIFLTVGQNNFGNKILLLIHSKSAKVFSIIIQNMKEKIGVHWTLFRYFWKRISNLKFLISPLHYLLFSRNSFCIFIKGQLISEWLLAVFIWTKKRRKIFLYFFPTSLK